jgi:pimeloyl-ACP methyl ester carboxylesterase
MTRFVLAAVAALAAATASAADYPFTVTVTGKGRPVVFVPGFGCAGKVWDSTVAHYKDTCECHVMTLAGFAGVPPVKGDGPFLDTVVKGIADYAKEKKFTNAAVVGHSLGAHVAIRVAEAAPDQFTTAVLVDGFPSMTGLNPNFTKEAAEQFGTAMRERFTKATPEEFKQEMRTMFGSMLKGEQLEEAMAWLAKADQPTAGKAMGELFVADARPDMGKVRGTVVLLGAFNPNIQRYGVPTAEAFEKALKAQVTGAKDGRVAVHPKCGHFIMYDEPKWFFEQVDGVIAK